MTTTRFPLISGDSVLGAFLAGATDADLPPLLINDDELSKFRTDLEPALLAEIEKTGLEVTVLFAIYRLHYEHRTRPAELSNSRDKMRRRLLRVARNLKTAADDLQYLRSSVELPYGPELLGTRPILGNEIEAIHNGFRVPTREEAAEHLQDLKKVAAQFSDEQWSAMSAQAAIPWRRVSAMTDSEYYPHYVHELAVAARRCWLMPFDISERLAACFGGRMMFSSNVVIGALSAELRLLAAQAERAAERLSTLGSPSGKGRKRAVAERSFREIFSEYARTTGRNHDEIGAKLFSKLFHAQDAEVFSRQRRDRRARTREGNRK
jgi:hypothetical protein